MGFIRFTEAINRENIIIMLINYIEYTNPFRFLDEEKADKFISNIKQAYNLIAKLKLVKRKNKNTGEITVRVYPINFDFPQNFHRIETFIEGKHRAEIRKTLILEHKNTYELIIFN